MLEHPVPPTLRRALSAPLGTPADALRTVNDVMRSVERQIDHPGDPPLSLKICERLDVSALGEIGLIARSSDTLRDAITTLEAFHARLLPFVRIDVRPRPDGGAQVSLAYDLPDRPARRIIHEAGLGMLVGLGRSFTEVRWSPTEAQMPSLSDGRRHWEAWLGCPITDAPGWSFKVKAEVLDLPLAYADPVIRGVLVPTLPPPPGDAGIVRRLTALLHASNLPSNVSAQAAARALGLSTRSLNRRLEDAGMSFRALRSDAVRRRAEALLAGGAPVGEVAQALGFATTSSLSRAWRRWTGSSPTGRR